MIDCVLAYPIPTRDSPTKGPALSIFYLGAMLEQKGLTVEYFDERFDKFDEFISMVKKEPLCVGVSSMTGYQLVGAKHLFEVVKKINPKVYTIFGGTHPSILPKHCIKEPLVDFVVVGEGEETLLELVMTLKNGGDLHKVDGIYWKESEEVIVNKSREFMNPSQWPFPMTQKNKKYFKVAADRDELMFQTSRGCMYKCAFCYNQVFNRRTWRPMPLNKFEKELKEFVREFKFRIIYINDDNIGSNKERIKEIAKILHSSDLSWSTGIRCNDIDEEIAKVLDENGCRELLLGAESGSDRILKEIIKKGYAHGTEDVRNCARVLSRTRIHGRYNFMCGTPTETKKELHESMDLADWIHKTDKNSLVNFDAYAPYPGSEAYEEALKTNFREPQTLEEWSKITLSNEIVPIAQNLYYISGLRFRGGKGDTTSRNFPGIRRFLILPFEISAHIRWRTRFLKYYGLERAIVKKLFAWASRRVILKRK
jgi:radical SAM superfamily enzyme YgiQ (UPF0313 family)